MTKILWGLTFGFLLSTAPLAHCQVVSFEVKAAQATSRGVSFEPAFPVDWERVARTNFRLFDVDHPDRAQVRGHYFEPGGIALFEYEALLPASKTSSYHYALAESGAVPLLPEKLLGSIGYDSNRSATRVQPPRFWGTMLARAATGQAVADVGFVMIADKPLTFQMIKVAASADNGSAGIVRTKVDEKKDAFVYRDSEGSHFQIGEHTTKFPGVKSAYVMSVSGDQTKYLFVRWAPDTDCVEGCCQHSYLLIRLGKEAEVVAESSYACDP